MGQSPTTTAHANSQERFLELLRLTLLLEIQGGNRADLATWIGREVLLQPTLEGPLLELCCLAGMHESTVVELVLRLVQESGFDLKDGITLAIRELHRSGVADFRELRTLASLHRRDLGLWLLDELDDLQWWAEYEQDPSYVDRHLGPLLDAATEAISLVQR